MSQHFSLDDDKELVSNRELIDPNANVTLDKKSGTYVARTDEPVTSKPKRSFALNRKQTIIGIIVVLLLGAGGGASYWLNRPSDDANTNSQPATTQDTAQKLGAAVSVLAGTAQYSKDGTNWRDITEETNLVSGDNIRSGADGRVVILIDDGSAIRLDKNAEVSLDKLTTKEIRVTQKSGQIYNRVATNDKRTYAVDVADQTYQAKGTAFRTIKQDSRTGVEVFQSTVAASTADTEVTEGKAFYSKHEQTDKQNKLQDLNLDELKQDEFITWNSQQDKADADFADKLGFLKDLDKPAPTASPTAKPATSTAGITLSGSQSEYSVNFSWKVSGVDTSKGFKLVRSSKTTSPVYPDNAVTFIEPGKTSFTLFVGDGTTYNYRLCAYREKTCDNYSNTVTVATAKKPKPSLEPGAVTLSLAGTNLSWTIAGTAPYGYKVVVGTSSNPTYEDNVGKYYTESTNYTLKADDFSAGTPYYIRVCKYTDGGCTDYSNEVTYTP